MKKFLLSLILLTALTVVAQTGPVMPTPSGGIDAVDIVPHTGTTTTHGNHTVTGTLAVGATVSAGGTAGAGGTGIGSTGVTFPDGTVQSTKATGSGSVTGGSCATNQYATSVGSNGAPTCAQVAYGQVSGTPTAYSLPTATNSVLGGVKPDGTSILNSSGVISVTPTSLGLGLVNNTSDANKPVSTAQATAIAAAQTAAQAASDPSGSASTAQAASLQKSSNLSDVANPATARTNLGVMANTAAAVAAAVGGQTGCGSAGYVWSPQSNTCIAQSAMTQISCSGTGADQTAIVAADSATANIALLSGNCVFTSNTSLAGTYWFFGGKFTPNTSVAVTLTQEPQASPTQIFSGSGTIVLSGAATTAYPEWFGATGNSASYTDQIPFNAAVTALTSGTVILTNPNYYGCGFIDAKSNVNVHGTGGPRGTLLYCNNATSTILSNAGTGTNCAAGGTFFDHFDNFGLRRTVTATGTAKGFDLSNSCWTEVHDVESWDSISTFYLNGTANPFIWNTQAVFSTLTTNTSHGYFIDSSNATGNSSVRLGPHAVTCSGSTNCGSTATTYGVYLVGSHPNDFFGNDVESAEVSYGFYVSSTAITGTYDSDIHCVGCINDGFTVSGVYIYNLANAATASMELIGGWNSSLYSTAGPAIDIEYSNGVHIVGTQNTIPTLGSQGSYKGIYINGGGGNTISDAVLWGEPYPIVINASNDNAITGNSLYVSNAGSYSAVSMISFTGSSNNSAIGNTMYGYGTTGISLDSSSNNNIVAPNNIDTTHITNSYSNSGSNNTTSIGNLQQVWSGTVTLPTAAIASGACAGPTGSGCANTFAATTTTGALTTDRAQCSLAGNPEAVTGYATATTGTLQIKPYVTAGLLNVILSNSTLASITPGAMTLNCGVQR